MFSTISKIKVEETNTWENQVFLTIDIDWAHDEILAAMIDIVERAGICATWFVTHATPLLSRLRASPHFELGIHPNFNFLLKGMYQNGRNQEEVLDKLLEIVPEAKSVRSHSTTQNSVLLDLFKSRGLIYESNVFIPEQSGMILTPWKCWSGLIRVPYFWEDDVHCLYSNDMHEGTMNNLTMKAGLKVFDFHPIHVYLNTENLIRYENTRDLHQRPSELIKHRHDGTGTRTHFFELLGLDAESVSVARNSRK